MPIILLHSSKTMKQPAVKAKVKHSAHVPLLLKEAQALVSYIRSLSLSQLQDGMKISAKKADEVSSLFEAWGTRKPTLPAIDIFLGDIYSGLQTNTFTSDDRMYAHDHLFILSGLYGILRALDAIQPYRLEMGYKLPGNSHSVSQSDITPMYTFWGDTIARTLAAQLAVRSEQSYIINLSAKEYTKAVFPYFKNIDALKNILIISPKFLTVNPKTGKPTFVTVHAKIARGAFARWLIQHRVEDAQTLKEFNEIGYTFSPELSTDEGPVFVAREFKGLGLSVRLKK